MGWLCDTTEIPVRDPKGFRIIYRRYRVYNVWFLWRGSFMIIIFITFIFIILYWKVIIFQNHLIDGCCCCAIRDSNIRKGIE